MAFIKSHIPISAKNLCDQPLNCYYQAPWFFYNSYQWLHPLITVIKHLRNACEFEHKTGYTSVVLKRKQDFTHTTIPCRDGWKRIRSRIIPRILLKFSALDHTWEKSKIDSTFYFTHYSVPLQQTIYVLLHNE